MGLLEVRVQPRASRNEIGDFMPAGALKVRVTAPPVDGKANDAVVKLLAKQLGITPSSVTVVRGATARNKTIEIDGLSDDEIRQRF